MPSHPLDYAILCTAAQMVSAKAGVMHCMNEGVRCARRLAERPHEVTCTVREQVRAGSQ